MSSSESALSGAINSTTVQPLSTTTDNLTMTDQRDENLAVIEIGVQAAIIVLAVVGNSVVTLTLSLRKKKLSRMHLMMVHLSLADLFVAFFNALPQLVWDITYRFQGGDVLCRLVKYFQIVAMYASSYVLLTTAIDRYYAICRPLTSATWTSGKVHRLVLAAWVISLACGLPQVAIFSYRETKQGSGIYDCWGVFDPEWKLQVYITWITVSVYIVPTVILAIAYGCICYAVWKSGRVAAKLAPSRMKSKISNISGLGNGAFLNSKQSSLHVKKADHGISRAKIKTVKLTMTVIACYLICWSPFFIAQMWAAFDPKAPFDGPTYTIILLLASLNSCTNPWIYMVFSQSICLQIGKAFGRRKARDSNAYSCVQTTCTELHQH